MLSNLDETMMHQTPTLFEQTYTSDHRFFDRLWFGIVHPDGEIGLITGMGTYKNMNVRDGFASVQHQRMQYNTRVSRTLRPDIDSSSVGPLHVDIIEPFKKLRLRLDPGEHPASYDLTWTAALPPYVEARHLQYQTGRVTQDSTRYDQVGSVSGWLELNGNRYEVKRWWSVRDHSWGVRPGVGGFEPTSVTVPSSMLWLWAYCSNDELGCMFQLKEDGEGNRIFLDGQVHWLEEVGREPMKIVDVSHDIYFVPGTRSYYSLTYNLKLENDEVLKVFAKSLFRPWAYSGTGYGKGYNDGKGLGAWRGESLLEWDIYDLNHPENVLDLDGNKIPSGHREQPVQATVNGKPGFGHFPVMSFGPIKRYALT
ncbi:MAG: hypothetical protein HN931_05565 [Desulfobacterales bacterium]|nr:hypothetical protein [Desulfobacterales bacterium]